MKYSSLKSAISCTCKSSSPVSIYTSSNPLPVSAAPAMPVFGPPVKLMLSRSIPAIGMAMASPTPVDGAIGAGGAPPVFAAVAAPAAPAPPITGCGTGVLLVGFAGGGGASEIRISPDPSTGANDTFGSGTADAVAGATGGGGGGGTIVAAALAAVLATTAAFFLGACFALPMGGGICGGGTGVCLCSATPKLRFVKPISGDALLAAASVALVIAGDVRASAGELLTRAGELLLSAGDALASAGLALEIAGDAFFAGDLLMPAPLALASAALDTAGDAFLAGTALASAGDAFGTRPAAPAAGDDSGSFFMSSGEVLLRAAATAGGGTGVTTGAIGASGAMAIGAMGAVGALLDVSPRDMPGMMGGGTGVVLIGTGVGAAEGPAEVDAEAGGSGLPPLGTRSRSRDRTALASSYKAEKKMADG